MQKILVVPVGNNIKAFVVYFVDNLENDYNKLNDDNNFDINVVHSNLFDHTTNESPPTKNGVKLSTSTKDQDIANTYFYSNRPTSEISDEYTDEILKHLNETVYNYFKDNFALVESAKENKHNFTEMYKNFTKRQLKKELQQLKNKQRKLRKFYPHLIKLLATNFLESL